MNEPLDNRREVVDKTPMSNRGFVGDEIPTPPLFDAFSDPSGVTCSLDMVRIKLGFDGAEGGEECSGRVCTFAHCDDYASYTSKVRPGGVHVLHVLVFGDTSCTLGMGQMGGNSKIDYSKGFIEFNPNKLGDLEGFGAWIQWLRPWVARSQLSRFDLAVDLAAARNSVRLSKSSLNGRAVYSATVSDSLTEYLGKRNNPGFVKVYDKAAELGVTGDLTRIELTCSGDWSLDGIKRYWPKVYRPSFDCGGLTSVTAALLSSLSVSVDNGLSIEQFLVGLDRKTRSKIRAALCSDPIPFPFEGAGNILKQALVWSRKVCRRDPLPVVVG